MSLSHSLYAHCPICGNSELRRISPEYVNSLSAFIWRTLRIPAFRCDPCRHKYFSIRPLQEAHQDKMEVSAGD